MGPTPMWSRSSTGFQAIFLIRKSWKSWKHLVQVNDYETALIFFFHISHNLTWYSAIVHKFTRVYPVCSTYEHDDSCNSKIHVIQKEQPVVLHFENSFCFGFLCIPSWKVKLEMALYCRVQFGKIIVWKLLSFQYWSWILAALLLAIHPPSIQS